MFFMNIWDLWYVMHSTDIVNMCNMKSYDINLYGTSFSLILIYVLSCYFVVVKCIYSSNKYLVSTYCVPSSFLVSGCLENSE